MGFQPHKMTDLEKEHHERVERQWKKFKKKVFITFGIIILFFLVMYGTDMNYFARKFGGDITINLQKNEKLVNITWKSSSMWILTRPMKAHEEPESYMFREDSNFGIFQGTVTLIESKSNN